MNIVHYGVSKFRKAETITEKKKKKKTHMVQLIITEIEQASGIGQWKEDFNILPYILGLPFLNQCRPGSPVTTPDMIWMNMMAQGRRAFYFSKSDTRCGNLFFSMIIGPWMGW